MKYLIFCLASFCVLLNLVSLSVAGVHSLPQELSVENPKILRILDSKALDLKNGTSPEAKEKIRIELEDFLESISLADIDETEYADSKIKTHEILRDYYQSFERYWKALWHESQIWIARRMGNPTSVVNLDGSINVDGRKILDLLIEACPVLIHPKMEKDLEEFLSMSGSFHSAPNFETGKDTSILFIIKNLENLNRCVGRSTIGSDIDVRDIYDGVFIFLSTFLDANVSNYQKNSKTKVRGELAMRVFKDHKDLFEKIPFLQYMYVINYRFDRDNPFLNRNLKDTSEKSFQFEIRILEDLRLSGRFNFNIFYDHFVPLYHHRKDFKKVEELLEENAEINRSPTDSMGLQRLAMVYFKNGKISQGTNLLESLLRNLAEKNQTEKYKEVRDFFVVALQNEGRDEEVAPYLEEIQREKLELRAKDLEKRRRKNAALNSLKSNLTVLNSPVIQEKTKEKAKEGSQEQSAPKKQKERFSSATVSQDVEFYAASSASSKGVSGRKFLESNPPKDEKRKTRGLPSAIQPVEMQVEAKETKLRTIEEILANNRNALTIFNRLFENVLGAVRTSAIQVSFTDIQTLMNALEQDLDPSKGKGSHKKITLNHNDLQPNLNDGFKESMIILTNRTYLKPYQIRQLQDHFLSLYLYPKDLEKDLVKAGRLQLDEAV